MKQIKVLNTEPIIKIAKMQTEAGPKAALIPCFQDADTNEIYEFPLLGPLAEAFQELVNGSMEKIPKDGDLVIPDGPVSEDSLARMAQAASGQVPPTS